MTNNRTKTVSAQPLLRNNPRQSRNWLDWIYSVFGRAAILRARAGFSFLEILVALMILVFGLTAIFGLFGAATYSHRRSINDELISRMATTIFSELESGQHPAALDLQNRTNQSHPQFTGIYTYDLTFSAIAGTEPTTRLVTLDIKYSKGRSTMLETFRTLIIFPLR